MHFQQPSKSKEELITLLDELGLYSNNIKKAIALAEKAHIDQKRKTGTPYLDEHIYPITFELAVVFADRADIEEILLTALLHDTVEDSPHRVSFKKIEDTFGKEVRLNVDILTKTPEDNIGSFSDAKKFRIDKKYVKRAEDSNSFPAIIVRIADRLNNFECMNAYFDRPRFSSYVDENIRIFIPFAKRHSEHYYQRMLELMEKYGVELGARS